MEKILGFRTHVRVSMSPVVRQAFDVLFSPFAVIVLEMCGEVLEFLWRNRGGACQSLLRKLLNAAHPTRNRQSRVIPAPTLREEGVKDRVT